MGLVFCTSHQICLLQQQVFNVKWASLCSGTLGLYTGYAPELAQWDVRFFPLILCFLAFLRHTNQARSFRKCHSDVYSRFPNPILFWVVVWIARWSDSFLRIRSPKKIVYRIPDIRNHCHSFTCISILVWWCMPLPHTALIFSSLKLRFH